MQKNALKMGLGFLIFLIPYIKGEPHLMISQHIGEFILQPIDSTIDLIAGTNVYLECTIVGGYSIEADVKWGRMPKVFRYRTFDDLKSLIDANVTLYDNSPVRRFEPVKLADRGLHFCLVPDPFFLKTVTVRVKEDGRTLNGNCSGKFRCTTVGHCISLHYKCDGKSDCLDGSDENHYLCNGHPCQSKIPCVDGRCIPKSWCCDRHTDDNCKVSVRPTCCPPLPNPYDPLFFNYANLTTTVTEVGTSSGSKYLFITICVVSALLSFVLFLFIISKICGFDTKPRRRNSPPMSSNICEHSECVLRRQFSTDATCLYRRDMNVINTENNNEMADPLILMNITDQPPSYAEVININKSNLELDLTPPPPYSSTNFVETESNRHCDMSSG